MPGVSQITVNRPCRPCAQKARPGWAAPPSSAPAWPPHAGLSPGRLNVRVSRQPLGPGTLMGTRRLGTAPGPGRPAGPAQFSAGVQFPVISSLSPSISGRCKSDRSFQVRQALTPLFLGSLGAHSVFEMYIPVNDGGGGHKLASRQEGLGCLNSHIENARFWRRAARPVDTTAPAEQRAASCTGPRGRPNQATHHNSRASQPLTSERSPQGLPREPPAYPPSTLEAEAVRDALASGWGGSSQLSLHTGLHSRTEPHAVSTTWASPAADSKAGQERNWLFQALCSSSQKQSQIKAGGLHAPAQAHQHRAVARGKHLLETQP